MRKLKQLVILGAGHAGSSAAISAASHLNQLNKENEVQITIINQSPNLTIRPRLYEYELEQTQVPLQQFLQPLNVTLLTASVTNIDLITQTVSYQQAQSLHNLSYDALIVALGSQLVHPNIAGIDKTCNIDSYNAALTFRDDLVKALSHTKKPIKIAILGGGITGVELATELPVTFKKVAKEYGVQFPEPTIYLLDRNIISKNMGLAIENEIQQALDMANIHCINNASINNITDNNIIYNETASLNADFIVSTLGLHANNVATQLSQPMDNLGRVYVNEYLQLPNYLNCFCAGDIAHAKPDESHEPVMSCQQGRPQGRYAGFNAISFLCIRIMDAVPRS